MSDKRRASAILHVSPECLERLRKWAAKEHISMGQMVEVLLDERDAKRKK
jgi:hypothetical protein